MGFVTAKLDKRGWHSRVFRKELVSFTARDQEVKTVPPPYLCRSMLLLFGVCSLGDLINGLIIIGMGFVNVKQLSTSSLALSALSLGWIQIISRSTKFLYHMLVTLLDEFLLLIVRVCMCVTLKL